MTFDQDGITVGHAEACAWADWFLLEQTRHGVPKDQKDQIGAIIYAFLDSGKAFVASGSTTSIPCPKCQGRGHSNLFLVGSSKPVACGNCQGTGKIEPSVGVDSGQA